MRHRSINYLNTLALWQRKSVMASGREKGQSNRARINIAANFAKAGSN